MNKTSTLSYRIHNFYSQSTPDLIDVKSLTDIRIDFPEVYNYLQEIECDVRQDVVDTILQKALNM